MHVDGFPRCGAAGLRPVGERSSRLRCGHVRPARGQLGPGPGVRDRAPGPPPGTLEQATAAVPAAAVSVPEQLGQHPPESGAAAGGWGSAGRRNRASGPVGQRSSQQGSATQMCCRRRDAACRWACCPGRSADLARTSRRRRTPDTGFGHAGQSGRGPEVLVAAVVRRQPDVPHRFVVGRGRRLPRGARLVLWITLGFARVWG